MSNFLQVVGNKKLVVISNRLPIVVDTCGTEITVSPASGGLITVIEPLLKANHGLWIGWPGIAEISENRVHKALQSYQQSVEYELSPVILNKEEVNLFYEGFSNKIIWPLFHDLPSECHFSPEFWRAYQQVNLKFAEKTHALVNDSDFIWIHDYHLILMGQKLREMGVFSKLVFFLHIPFAPLDIFMKIPWRLELLSGMMQYDFIGFQTQRDHQNFTYCVKQILKDVIIRQYDNHSIFVVDGREVYVGVFPIGIDFHSFDMLSSEDNVIEKSLNIRKSLLDRKIVFSVDRLDYTKGIPYRLLAIKEFLRKYPEMHQMVTFVQVLVPSRTCIQGYTDLKEKIDLEVSRINGEFTTNGWVPIHYMFHSISREELVAYYRAADVVLVTPVKDGMNLIAKEYIASNVEETGVVILSEFAGSACQLKEGALLINPYDIEGLANTIVYALNMPEDQRRMKMKSMRRNVQIEDSYRWVTSILHAVESGIDFELPIVEKYIVAEDG